MNLIMTLSPVLALVARQTLPFSPDDSCLTTVKPGHASMCLSCVMVRVKLFYAETSARWIRMILNKLKLSHAPAAIPARSTSPV